MNFSASLLFAYNKKLLHSIIKLAKNYLFIYVHTHIKITFYIDETTLSSSNVLITMYVSKNMKTISKLKLLMFVELNKTECILFIIIKTTP